MSARPRLLLRVSAEEERVARSQLRADAIYCKTNVEAVAMLGTVHLAGVVWELSDGMPAARQLPVEVLQAAGQIPLLVRARLTPAVAEEIMRVARFGSILRVSVCGFDSLESALTELVDAQGEPSAERLLIARLSGVAGAELRLILVAAVVLGKRYLSPRTLARACGISSTTLRRRFDRCTELGPRECLGWIRVLHAMWRLAYLGFPLKRCAAATGFPTSAAARKFLIRYTGSPPSALCRAAVFDEVLERFVVLIVGATPGVGRAKATASASRDVVGALDAPWTYSAFRMPADEHSNS